MMEEGEGEGANDIIRCICGFNDDDGFTIQCEKCYVWQHVECVLGNGETEPNNYYCEECDPRELNVQLAIQKQLESRKKPSRRSQQSYVNPSSKDRLSPRKPNRPRRTIPNSSTYPRSSGTRRNKPCPRLTLPSMDEDNSIFKNIKYEESKNYGPPVYSDSDVLEDNEQTTNDFVNELDGILMDLQKSKSWRGYKRQTLSSPTKKTLSLPFKNPIDQAYSTFSMDCSFNQSSINRIYHKFVDIHITRVCRLLSRNIAPENVPWGSLSGRTFYQDDDEISEIEEHPLVLDAKVLELVVGFSVVDYIQPQEENTEITEFREVVLQGLFSTQKIPAGSLINEILGSIGFVSDIARKSQKSFMVGVFHTPSLENKQDNSTMDIDTSETDQRSILLPPFVFHHPAKILKVSDQLPDNIQNSLIVDTREYGSSNGRFIRSYCGGDPDMKSSVNSTLRSVFVFDDPELSLLPTLKLCIFATRQVSPGEEFVLDLTDKRQISFPCVCKDVGKCRVALMIKDIERGRIGELKVETEELMYTAKPRDAPVKDEMDIDEEEEEEEVKIESPKRSPKKRRRSIEEEIPVPKSPNIPVQKSPTPPPKEVKKIRIGLADWKNRQSLKSSDGTLDILSNENKTTDGESKNNVSSNSSNSMITTFSAPVKSTDVPFEAPDPPLSSSMFSTSGLSSLFGVDITTTKTAAPTTSAVFSNTLPATTATTTSAVVSNTNLTSTTALNCLQSPSYSTPVIFSNTNLQSMNTNLLSTTSSPLFTTPSRTASPEDGAIKEDTPPTTKKPFAHIPKPKSLKVDAAFDGESDTDVETIAQRRPSRPISRTGSDEEQRRLFGYVGERNERDRDREGYRGGRIGRGVRRGGYHDRPRGYHHDRTRGGGYPRYNRRGGYYEDDYHRQWNADRDRYREIGRYEGERYLDVPTTDSFGGERREEERRRRRSYENFRDGGGR